jgi:hypothetical protein
MRLPVVVLIILLAGCVDARVHTVEAFEAARDAGDYETARSYMGDDPRVWWGVREGPGAQWALGGGPWRGWDAHFHGDSARITPWRVDGDRVWADMRESNDYYRLLEREPGFWRRSYFFDGGDRITGTMIGAVDDPPPPSGRDDEFEAWARANHPGELDYLEPDGKIDPTGDRPQRYRALLNTWRASVGLPPIEAGAE